MTVENDFLPFATGAGANVIDQPTYAASAALVGGFQAGTAQSAQLNKVWRQSSIMAAVLAQFIVAQTGHAAIDDGTTATLLANFTAAVNAASKSKVVLADTGAANVYAAANPVPLTALPTATGVVQTVKIKTSNTGNSTYAPDGLAAAPIYGRGGSLLQGSELPANGVATLVSYVGPLLNGGNLCWVLYECIGGAQQVAPAAQSQHAVQLGQIQTQAGTAFATGGVAPNFTLTPAPTVQSLVAPLRFRVKFNAAGTTGSNTLNISGLGAVALMQYGPGGVLQPAVIPSGLLSDVEYNGTYCIVLDPVTAGLVASGITVVNATGSLTASVAGGTVIGNSSSATTQTLPAASTLPAGVRVEFLNINTGTMTVARAGADTITVNNTTVTTLALGNGDTLTLESNGANGWYAVAGSAQLQYAAIMQSVQSLGTSGYRKIPAYPGDPSPLIIQWGLVASSTSGAAPATFPIAFPTACYGVTLGTQYGSGSPAISQLESSPSATGFTFGMWVSGSRIVQSASYFAFGK
ncbi:conserved protein of unknown function [Burkholderia multivorans]